MRTGFHRFTKIGQIFHNKHIVNNNNNKNNNNNNNKKNKNKNKVNKKKRKNDNNNNINNNNNDNDKSFPVDWLEIGLDTIFFFQFPGIRYHQ